MNEEATDLTELILQNAVLNSSIINVGQIERLFRKSPTKNTLLQKYVKDIIGEEFFNFAFYNQVEQLINMVERFLLLEDVRKS